MQLLDQQGNSQDIRFVEGIEYGVTQEEPSDNNQQYQLNHASTDNEQNKSGRQECHYSQVNSLQKKQYDQINELSEISMMKSQVDQKSQNQGDKTERKVQTKTSQPIYPQKVKAILLGTKIDTHDEQHLNKTKQSKSLGILADLKNTQNKYSKDKNKCQKSQNKLHLDMFTKIQLKYLSNFFKYSCQKLQNAPKSATFDQVKVFSQTMNLTEWMTLCKNLKVFQFFISSRDVVRTLSSIFKKIQNNNKRLQFNKFCQAFKALIQTMINSMQFNHQKSDIKIIKKYVGILTQQDHLVKIKNMGVNPNTIMQQKGSSHIKIKPIIKLNKQYQTKSLYEKSEIQKSQRKSSPTQLDQKNRQKLTNSVAQKQNKNQKTNIKFYRKRQDRVRSRIMKNLGVSNINKLLPSDQLKQNFDNLLKQDDKFLKDYLRQKKEVKNGILKRIQQKQSKYNSSSLMKNRRNKEKQSKKHKTVFDM